jgi:uncharacterized protein YkwD
MARRFLVLAILSGLLAAPALFFAESGHVSDQTPEERMYGYINVRRADHGLSRLTVGSYIQGYAEDRAITIRRNRKLLPHDPCYLCGEVLAVWTGSAWSVFLLWMNSDVHRHILMLPDLQRIGCGMVTDRFGYHWWACEVRY